MISLLLGGPDRIVAIAHLDETPARTALFSRREIRRVLDVLDALDPDDQRVEIAILPYSAPILVARPRDPVGEGWVAVAGHLVTPDEEANNSETPKSSPAVNVPVKPDSSERDPLDSRCVKPPAPKEEKRDRYDTGFPDKPLPKSKTWGGGDPRPLKMEETPAPAPAPAAKMEEGGTCEGCGGPVTKTQKQMSQLFLNKTLCKGCMDAATKGASE